MIYFICDGVDECCQAHVTDTNNQAESFRDRYVEFTEIDGETLRFTTVHTDTVLQARSPGNFPASNSITLNGLDGFQDNYFFKVFRGLMVLVPLCNNR